MSKGKRMTLQDAQDILARYDEYHELKGRIHELKGRIEELKPPPTKHNRKRALEIILAMRFNIDPMYIYKHCLEPFDFAG